MYILPYKWLQLSLLDECLPVPDDKYRTSLSSGVLADKSFQSNGSSVRCVSIWYLWLAVFNIVFTLDTAIWFLNHSQVHLYNAFHIHAFHNADCLKNSPFILQFPSHEIWMKTTRPCPQKIKLQSTKISWKTDCL